MSVVKKWIPLIQAVIVFTLARVHGFWIANVPIKTSSSGCSRHLIRMSDRTFTRTRPGRSQIFRRHSTIRDFPWKSSSMATTPTCSWRLWLTWNRNTSNAGTIIWSLQTGQSWVQDHVRKLVENQCDNPQSPNFQATLQQCITRNMWVDALVSWCPEFERLETRTST